MKNIKEKVDIIVNACEEKIAEDIVVLDVSDHTTVTDYLVICSGNSKLQTQAIAQEVEHELEDRGDLTLSTQGYREGKWIVVDANEVVVHIFHRDERDYYDLENLWDINI